MVDRLVSVDESYHLPAPVQSVINGIIDTKLAAITPVTSVASRTGAVVLTSADVGLSGVNANETALRVAADASETSARIAADALKVDKGTLGFNVKDSAYGAVGNGGANDAPAFDALIAALNSAGHLTNLVPLTVIIPAGVYNLKAGGIRALLVSNVSVKVDPWAIFLLRDGPVWTLGNSSTTIYNFLVTGGQPRTDYVDTLAATCPWVYAVNAGQVTIDSAKFLRCQAFKGVSNLTLVNITLNNISGSGPVDRHWVEIDTTASGVSAAAGLYLINSGGYAFAPAVNPATVPRPITGVTKANPAVVTSATHGLTTGDRIRIGGVGGMTQLNGNDYTVTVVNANTYNLDGTNSTAYGTYTSGGWQAELLWSYGYDSAVVGIKGHWDTAIIRGGLYQHWPWLWSVESQGTVSYLFDEEVTWDYGAKGRFNINLNGGSITNIKVNGGWHFCLNEEWIRIYAPGAGYVTDLTIRGHVLGMTGRDFIDDANTNKILNLEIDGLRVLGMGRARTGTTFLVRPSFSGNNTTTLRDIRCENPGTYYGTSTYLLADVGITVYQDTRYRVTDCEIYAATTNYVAAHNSTTTAGQRMIRGNKTYVGTLPEYITTNIVTPPASATATTNYTGLTQIINLYAGTMTAVSKNGVQIATGTGPFTLSLRPGETWSCTYSVAPTLVVSYSD